MSLNGNIIAAQAGEHGRAFRVVCSELGGLADQSKGTAAEVRKLIAAMGLEEFSSQAELEDFEDLMPPEELREATRTPHPPASRVLEIGHVISNSSRSRGARESYNYL